jgi:hypothetical protein
MLVVLIPVQLRKQLRNGYKPSSTGLLWEEKNQTQADDNFCHSRPSPNQLSVVLLPLRFLFYCQDSDTHQHSRPSTSQPSVVLPPLRFFFSQDSDTHQHSRPSTSQPSVVLLPMRFLFYCQDSDTHQHSRPSTSQPSVVLPPLRFFFSQDSDTHQHSRPSTSQPSVVLPPLRFFFSQDSDTHQHSRPSTSQPLVVLPPLRFFFTVKIPVLTSTAGHPPANHPWCCLRCGSYFFVKIPVLTSTAGHPLSNHPWCCLRSGSFLSRFRYSPAQPAIHQPTTRGVASAAVLFYCQDIDTHQHSRPSTNQPLGVLPPQRFCIVKIPILTSTAGHPPANHPWCCLRSGSGRRLPYTHCHRCSSFIEYNKPGLKRGVFLSTVVITLPT